MTFRDVPAPRRLRAWSLAMLVYLAAGGSGCVIDAKLRPDGWCKLRMVYPLQSNTTSVALEKRRFNSAHFRVASLLLRPDGTARVVAGIDDVTKLSSTQMFRSVTVTRVREGTNERLTATFRNAMPKEVKEEGKPGVALRITVPGPVREANGVVDGNHVDWKLSLAEFAKQRAIDFSVLYPAPTEPAGRQSR